MNYTLLKQIDGQTHRTILTHRKFATNVLTAFLRQLFPIQTKYSKLLRQRIWGYAVASTDNAAFIIGGHDTGNIDIIAKFQDNQWTRYGSLKTARHAFGTITSGDQTMIIGGYSNG